MSLRVETERILAPKLRSPLGQPLYKPKGKPHILFPYGAKYRSPNRRKLLLLLLLALLLLLLLLLLL